MRRMFILLFLFSIFIPAVFASNNPSSSTILSINVNFHLHQSHAKGMMNKNLKTTWKTAASDHHWTVIQNQPNNMDSIILLSKIAKADNKEVMVHFLVLDTSKTPNVIAAPQLIVPYGQKGQIMLGGNTQKMELTIAAVVKKV